VGIEVKHDSLNLPAKIRIRVKNAKIVEKYINLRFEENFNRGYRLRFVPDAETNTMELSARRMSDIDMALRALKDSGHYVEMLPWKINTLLKKRLKSWEVKGETI